MHKSINDTEWEKLFEKYNILEKVLNFGYTEISATEIKEFREARLMTKFDHKSQLPKLFAENQLSILPITRGGYVIGAFETFYDFNIDDVEVVSMEFPTFLESLNHKEIINEATAINCAFVSKILHDFTEEETLFPTVNGRMGSSSFDFKINSSKGLFKVCVENSQIEIDGGFEGENSLSLIEAKNYISDNFLVRQLYYPFKLWSNKINKRVRPVFLTYTNGVFHLREYAFTDVEHYNSLVLVKHKKYVVQEGCFNLEVLDDLLKKTKTVSEPEIPFPQADSFERIINLCELLQQKEFISKEEITQNYDFDARQTDYYSNAGKYLNLITIGRDPISGQTGCFLTKEAKHIFNLNIIDRQKEFVKLIVSHSVFKETLKLYLNNGEVPAKESIVDIMKNSKLFNIDSESTYRRRASTILGWLNWIINQITE
jgi:hypothetical protein